MSFLRNKKRRLIVLISALITLFGVADGVSVAEPSGDETPGAIKAFAASMGLTAVPVDTEAADVWYIIITRAAPDDLFCLDAKLQTIGNGGVVQLWTCNGANQQQWAVHNGSSLKNRASPAGRTLVLDAKAQEIRNGGTIQLWDYNGGPQQRWSEYENFYLQNGASPAGTRFVLDAKAQEIRNGGKIQLWQLNRGPQQQWSAEPVT